MRIILARSSLRGAAPIRYVGSVLCSMLDRTAFANRLYEATIGLFALTEKYCYNKLSKNVRFRQDFRIPDLRVPHAGMDVVDKEVLRDRLQREHDLLQPEEVLAMLYRDGRVPGYINTTILHALPNMTIVELLVSRRLKTDEELFHRIDRYPPFHVLVRIPPAIELQTFDGRKWDVNWEWDRRRPRPRL